MLPVSFYGRFTKSNQMWGLLGGLLLVLSTFTSSNSSASEQTAVVSSKRFTVGVSVWTGYPRNLQGFQDGLVKADASLDQIEFVVRSSEGNRDKQREIASEFLNKKVDLVYTLTTPGTAIIKEMMPDFVPIVYSIVTYPADSGLIQSFEYSGNNLVGTSNFVPYKYYIEMLNRFVPEVKRLAVFSRAGEPNSRVQAVTIKRLLRRQSIETIHVEVESLEDVQEEGKKLLDQVDAFMTTTDTLMQSGGEDILIELSLEHKIPILSSNKFGIQKGSTFGPVVDFYEIGKMSGEMAAKILLEQKAPSTMSSRLQLPPTLLVNKTSLEAIGLSFPEQNSRIEYVE